MTDNGWVWTRFRADEDDWRPVTWPPPGPCWCTGYGDGYSVVVAYVREGQDVRTWWPEASEVDSEPAPDGPVFSGRFPRPEWWGELYVGRLVNGTPGLMRQARPKGTCQHCGRAFDITRAAVIRHHSDLQDSNDGLPWHPTCPGAGKPPRDEEPARA